MLSPDHVRAKVHEGQLLLRELGGKPRARALELAEQLLVTTAAHVGRSRDELAQALELIEVRPTERRLAEGLCKLLDEASEFEAEADLEPTELRSELFLEAARQRREATLEAPFDRVQVLSHIAQSRGLEVGVIERALYADLRGAHRLVRAPTHTAEQLVSWYEQSQVQAVLLRAVNVVATVHCRSPEAYRALFQKLKFRQLLYRLEALPNSGYRIHIDGPFSLFEAVTKYGLELALTLPSLQACDVLDLVAEVRWGKHRSPLRFEYRQVAGASGASEPQARDEVRVLMQEFERLDSAWKVRPAEAILELPGSGLCVPDLEFRHPEHVAPVYVEVLGFWSRAAVFRRIELVEAGLDQQLVFALSSKLRVSEELLDDQEHAALYVFRGKPSARALERKLDQVASAGARRPRR